MYHREYNIHLKYSDNILNHKKTSSKIALKVEVKKKYPYSLTNNHEIFRSKFTI